MTEQAKMPITLKEAMSDQKGNPGALYRVARIGGRLRRLVRCNQRIAVLSARIKTAGNE